MTIEEKEKILNYVDLIGLENTAKKFQLSVKELLLWQKERESLLAKKLLLEREKSKKEESEDKIKIQRTKSDFRLFTARRMLAVFIFLLLMFLMSFDRCFFTNFLLKKLGAAPAFLLLMILLTPFSLLTFGQFFWEELRRIVKNLEQFNLLIIFFAVFLVLVANIVLMVSSNLVCYFLNLMKTLF